MPKRLKGLYLDGDPVDQPPETYRDAVNVNINDQVGAVTTERGNELLDQLPVGHIELGHVLLADGRIVILSWGAGVSEIGILEEGTYTALNLNGVDLTFDPSADYQITHKVNNRDEAIIYWTDKVNPPRFLNIDNLPGFTKAQQFNLFPNIESPAILSLDRVNDFGGVLVSGSYQFTIRYVDTDGNTTNFLDITSPISVNREKVRTVTFDGNTEAFTQGNATAPTSKSIRLSIDKLDQSYDKYQIGVIRHEGASIASVELLQPRSIGSEDTVITYTGNEDAIDGSLEEVLINNVHYDSAGSITQSDDVLYLGDLSKKESLNLQPVANNITTHLVEKKLGSQNNGYWAHGDETTVFFNRSFKRGEVYAFYVSFILSTGEETRAFHIPGRAPVADETSAATGIPNNFLPAKNFHFYAQARNNDMGYWENEQETYPQDADTWGSLAGQKVRHHRFPDTQSYPFVISGTDWESRISILGVQFKNIVIPEEFRGEIKGIKFYSAKKDLGDRLIIDQALANAEVIDNDDLYRTFLLPKSSSLNTYTDTILSLVPFSTMLRNISLASVSYLRKVGTYVNDYTKWYANPDQTNSQENNGVVILNDQVTQDRQADDSILEVDAIAKIPAETDEVQITNLGFPHNKKARGAHSHVLVKTAQEFTMPVFYSAEGVQSHAIMEMCQYLKSVFTPFDQQELIPLGQTIADVDNYFADAPSTGTKATGSITIESDAPSIQDGAVAETQRVTGSGAVENDTDILLNISGESQWNVTLPVVAGTTAPQVISALQSEVNADGSLPYTVEIEPSGEFYLQWKQAAEITYSAIISESFNQALLDGDNGLVFSPSIIEFSGGRDPAALEGRVLIRVINGVDTIIGEIDITVQLADTKLDIATKMANYVTNTLDFLFSGNVVTINGEPGVELIPDDLTNEYDYRFEEIENVAGLLYDTTDMSGQLARGSIIVTDDAPATDGGSAAVSDIMTLSGTSTVAFQFSIFVSGLNEEPSIAVPSGESAANIVSSLITHINGGGYSFSATADSATSFYLTMDTVGEVNYDITPLADSGILPAFGIDATPNPTPFTGGSDQLTGKAGDLDLQVAAMPAPINIDVDYGDTALDIITKISTAINTGTSYTSSVNTSGINPQAVIVSAETGSQYNGTIDQLQNTLFIGNIRYSLTGGAQEGSITVLSEPATSTKVGELVFDNTSESNSAIGTVGIDIQDQETALDIANNLANEMNTNGAIKYTATVDSSGTHPVVLIEANDVGSEFNGTYIEVVNSTIPLIENTVQALTGGTDETSNQTPSIYGGDTYINSIGLKISTLTLVTNNQRKIVMHYIVESYDNIAYRQGGADITQLNGNNKALAEELIDQDYVDDGIEDNYFEYDEAHSTPLTVVRTTPFPKNFKEILEFPSRVIRNANRQEDSFEDTFRVFLENDYLDLPRHRGRITNLEVLQNILHVHMERSLFRTKGREEITTQDFRAFLGAGDIFAVKPDEVLSTQEGYAGLQSSRHAISTPMGYFFVDQEDRKVFLQADGPKEISDLGMRNFFNENLKWFIDQAQPDAHNLLSETGIAVGYDPEFKRLLLTKRDYQLNEDYDPLAIGYNETTESLTIDTGTDIVDIDVTNPTYFTDKSFTVSFLPEIGRWVSFHSYKPYRYMRSLNHMISLKDEGIYRHVGPVALFYGTQYPMVFEFVDNREASQTKLVQNVEFITYVKNNLGDIDHTVTFDKIRLMNELQDSGDIDLVYFTNPNGNTRNVGHTWKVNKFRDLINPNTRQLDSGLPFHKKKKFTGKYIKVRLYYTPDTYTNPLLLISATVNFRRHLR